MSFAFAAVLHAFPYGAPTEEANPAANGLRDSSDVAFGDADGNGTLDIVACGRSGAGTNRQLQFLSGDGAGGFANPTNIPPGGNQGLGFCALALGDVDNDNDLDVVVTGRESGAPVDDRQHVRVYLRGAAGWTLLSLAGATAGVESGGLSLGDYDNDGDLDILATGFHQEAGAGDTIHLYIYRNDTMPGAVAFTQIAPAGATGLWNGGAAWGDFDEDGDLDMLVSGAEDAAQTVRRTRVYQNNGSAAWTAVDLAPALSSGAVAWGDFNGDGNLDAVASGTNDGVNEEIRWWAGNGAGGFGAAQNVAAASAGLVGGGLAVGDVDRDGDLDVAANGSSLALAPATIVYTNVAGVFAANALPAAQVLRDGALALGDANNNGTLDLAAVGVDNGGNARVRFQQSASAANAAPAAPAGLAASFAYSAAGPSTATFRWNPVAEGGAGGTSANLMSYDIQISTINNAFAAGTFTFPSMRGATPRRGAYHRPPLSGGQHYALLKSTSPLDSDLAPYGLQVNTTYYFRVRAVDAGLMEGAWAVAPVPVYTAGPPSRVVNLSTQAAAADGQMVLTWTSPASGGPAAAYDIRWALTPITNDAEFAAATPLTSTAPAAPGTLETRPIRGVPPEQTVYFALKTTNGIGTSALSTSASGVPLAFDRTQIEVAGAGAGLLDGDVTWGDLNADGNWDIVAEGLDSGGTRRLWAFRNDGVGGFITPPTALTGLANGNVDLGDFDGDGKLDILASGNSAAGVRELRVHLNDSPGGGAFDFTVRAPVEVPGLAGRGFDFKCGLKWADFNNDGDLDVAVCGDEDTSAQARLYIYLNQGGVSFDTTTVVNVSGTDMFRWGDMAVADYNNDGRLDIAAMGYNTAQSIRQLVIYENLGGTPPAFAARVTVGAPNGFSSGALDAGDADGDAWVDLVAQGSDGTNPQLLVWENTTASPGSPIAFNTGLPRYVEGAALGLNRGEVAWGDYNNDGRADVLSHGGNVFAATPQPGYLRVYANASSGPGNFAFGPRVDAANPGTAMRNEGAAAWGDYDQDGDADIVVSGQSQTGAPQLRVYRNHWGATPGATNNPPNAPATLAADFTFSAAGVSTATFKWDPASDDITPPVGLKYQVQAATTAPAYSAPLAINTPSPQYFPQIYDGNTRHGTVLVSTNPWDPQSGTLTGLVTDTTYYFHVKTIDGGFLESGWSADAFLWTGVAPGTSTISAGAGIPGQATMTWTSAGDDQDKGLLTGNYRIQYSTNPSAAWSETTTPADGFTLTIPTTTQVAGSAQSAAVTGLLEGSTYYFRLWTQDDVGLWSAISNQTTAYIQIGFRDVAVTETEYLFGTVGLGLSTQTAAGVTVTYSGNVNSTYRIYASTVTPSPWTLSTSTGTNAAVLYAGFDAAMPALSAFGPEDVVLTAPQPCTASVYALGQSCLSLAPGSVRTLWLRLDMPSESDASVEQQIQITVEAGP